MVSLSDIHPIGSIVQIKSSDKKIMVIGILQTDLESNTTYDYSGLVYPEGLIGQEQLLFNHEDIELLVFRGFDDEERQQMLIKLEEELTSSESESVVQIMDIFLSIYESRNFDNTVTINIRELANKYELLEEDLVGVVNMLIEEQFLDIKNMRKNKFLITNTGIAAAESYKIENNR